LLVAATATTNDPRGGFADKAIEACWVLVGAIQWSDYRSHDYCHEGGGATASPASDVDGAYRRLAARAHSEGESNADSKERSTIQTKTRSHVKR